MKVLLINQSKASMPKAFLKTWINRVERALKPEHKFGRRHELIVVFVTKAEMKRMNHRYRKKDYATDILSFPPAEDTYLGELVICPAVVREQSARTGLSPRNELGFMVLHGILHLLGYEHEGSSRKAKRMFELQNKIFKKLTR